MAGHPQFAPDHLVTLIANTYNRKDIFTDAEGPWIFPPFNFLKIGTMEFAVPVPISQCTRIGKTFDLSLHGSQRTFSTFAMYSVPAERRFQGSCAGA